MKALIVEDEEQNRYLLEKLFKGYKYSALSAKNGEEALELLAREEDVGFVISDILMPGMDGFQLCRRIRTSKEPWHNIPFIFYTATYTSREDERFALALGADEFIIKPTDPKALIEKIQELVEHPHSDEKEVESLVDLEIPSIDDELVYLKEYNERLINKLETKVIDLQQKNRLLEESEKLFHTLANNSAVAVLRLDHKGIVLYSNLSWESLIGEEEKGNSWLKRIHPDDKKTVLANWELSVKSKSAFSSVFRLKTSASDEYWVLAQLNPLVLSDGNLQGYVGCVTDITQQKNLEKEEAALQDQLRQSQKLEALGRLAGGISHDFNNMLGIITCALEEVQEEDVSKDCLQENLKAIGQATLRAQELVNQVLTFSRGQKAEFEFVNVGEIIRETGDLLKRKLPKGVRLNYEFEKELPLIFGNSNQLYQVFLNLITNASQAIGKKGGQVTLRLEKVKVDQELLTSSFRIPPGSYILSTVEDNGSGISSEDIPHIFEPYYTTKPFDKGSGIGLAVVEGIVKQHQGVIRVSSKEKKGARFEIFLPFVHQKGKTKAPQQDNLLVGNKENVLIVDNDEDLLPLEKRMLERLGYKATVTHDPFEALKLIKKNPQRFDAVLSDFVMPGLNGLMLFEKIKEIRSDIPFLLFTGFVQDPIWEKAKKSKIAVIKKPFALQALAESLKKSLR